MVFLHTGNHVGMNARELASHILEPDHVVFALTTIAVGVWCYHARRRAEARNQERAEARARIGTGRKT
jgi:hypothetical protein